LVWPFNGVLAAISLVRSCIEASSRWSGAADEQKEYEGLKRSETFAKKLAEDLDRVRRKKHT
jgi:hypothetical protein